jgi:hypothetical protein
MRAATAAGRRRQAYRREAATWPRSRDSNPGLDRALERLQHVDQPGDLVELRAFGGMSNGRLHAC